MGTVKKEKTTTTGNTKAIKDTTAKKRAINVDNVETKVIEVVGKKGRHVHKSKTLKKGEYETILEVPAIITERQKVEKIKRAIRNEVPLVIRYKNEKNARVVKFIALQRNFEKRYLVTGYQINGYSKSEESKRTTGFRKFFTENITIIG